MLSRFSFIVIVGIGLGGCASNKIDESELPPEAFVDDGVDYYSVDLTDVPSSGADQWRLDENGEKIHTLNRATIGDTSVIYVGDLRYLKHEEQLASSGRNNDLTRTHTLTRPAYGSNSVGDPRLRRQVPSGLRYRTQRATTTSPNNTSSSSRGSSGSTSQPTSTTPSPRAPRTTPRPRVRTEPRARPQPSRTTSPTREIDR